MSLSIINDSTITCLPTINWNKVSKIKEIPQVLAADGLSRHLIRPIRHRLISDDQVNVLSLRLRHLKTALDGYNPSLIQKIINFFTGRMFTLMRLRSVLTEVITKVSAVTQAIFDDKARRRKQEEDKARADAENAKRLADLLAEQVRRSKLSSSTLLDDATEADYEKGNDIRVQISSEKPNAEDLSHKLHLIGKSVKYIDNCVSSFTTASEEAGKGDQPVYGLEVALKVQRYFHSMLKRLQKGENVIIGRWYHATGHSSEAQAWTNVKDIITSKAFIQKQCPRGYGAYFSSVDEHMQGYGLITFVLGEESLTKNVLGQHREVHYFPGDPIGRGAQPAEKQNRNGSLWIRVRNDLSRRHMTPCVPATQNTVAFITTHANHVERLRSELKALKFRVSVLDREEVDFIRKVYDSVETQRPATADDISKDPFERAGARKQEKLVKYYDKRNNKLIFVGGRHVPLDWQPHELRENFTNIGFPRFMEHLKWLDDNRHSSPQLEAAFAP